MGFDTSQLSPLERIARTIVAILLVVTVFELNFVGLVIGFAFVGLRIYRKKSSDKILV